MRENKSGEIFPQYCTSGFGEIFPWRKFPAIRYSCSSYTMIHSSVAYLGSNNTKKEKNKGFVLVSTNMKKGY